MSKFSSLEHESLVLRVKRDSELDLALRQLLKEPSTPEQLREAAGTARMQWLPRQTFDKWKFSGEDTWMYLLFAEIEKWEQKHSDPGAIRLDLVIYDAVLEHPSDIRRSDEIQERRDGNLHTIVLNLMPMEEWANSDLPLRCVQYPASGADLGGMLRTLISEFVAIYM